jgi:FHA domain-containing protein
MKPVGAADARTEPPVPSKTGSPQATVADQLRDVDTSVLEPLVTIRQQEMRLEQFRTRASEMKESVSEPVYRRVIEDYTKRGATLKEQATPLRAKARLEYRKLRQLVEQIGVTFERAKTQKEELQFRHAVGELDDAELTEQLQSPQSILDTCESDMARIDEHKARFIDAVGSEAALEPAPSDLAAPSAPAAARATDRAASAASPEATMPAAAKDHVRPEPAPAKAQEPPASKAPAAAVQPEPDADDQTMMVMSDETQMISRSPVTAAAAASAHAATTGARAAAAPAAADSSAGQTVLVPLGALISEGDALLRPEYRLGAINYLGRSEENQIQIKSPDVSRKHAVITAAPGGFELKDLGSQNGVAVNGQKVSQRKLVDKDRIDIAGATFVFRSPWPVPAAKGAAASQSAKK